MERVALIHKTASDLRVPPNFGDYAAACADFSWDDMRRRLNGLPGGGCNIAYAAVDRHAAGPLRERTAFRFLGLADANGACATRDITYAELARLARRFTNVLRRLGIVKGDRLFVLAGRIPELYIAVLGSLRNGTVVAPLFSAFGPEPIATRIQLGDGQVLVTTDLHYQRKVEKIRSQLPMLRHVLLVGENGAPTDISGTLDLSRLMAEVDDQSEIAATGADDMALLHFTSGTTGTPKGAVHVHGAVATHYATGLYALDLHAEDIFWCTADPGWVTGTSYGIIAPLLWTDRAGHPRRGRQDASPAHVRPERSGETGAFRKPAQLGNVRPDPDRDQPGRARGGCGVRRDLPAAGGPGGIRKIIAAPVGGWWQRRDSRPAPGSRQPGSRSSRQRRP